MLYKVQIKAEVEAYIENYSGLSDVARRGIIANVIGRLATRGDHCRIRASSRIAHESYLFWFQLDLLDAEMGRTHRFRFIVSDEHADQNVLAVEFVETGNPPPLAPRQE